MSFREALSYRPFAVLLGARAISRVGDSLHEIALIWLVLQETGDARLVTLVVVASTVPNVLLSLPAGALVDRFDRRRVLIVADLVRGIVVLAIPLFGHGERLVPVAVAVALVVGLVEPFAGPARGATLPRTVPDDQLDSANALFSLTSSVSRTLYVLGGGVVAFAGAYPAFYVNAATFLVSASLLTALPSDVGVPDGEQSDDPAEPDDGGGETRRVLRDAREGLAYVRHTPVVLAILAVGVLVGTLSDPLGIITPVFVEDTLSGGSFVYGLLFGAIFFGSTVGDLAVSRASAYIDGVRAKVVVGSLVTGGLALVVAGVIAPHTTVPIALAVVAFTIFGITLSLATTPLDTLLQRTVPNDMLGRVSSVFSVIGLVGPPIALAATGPLVYAFGPDVILIADGALVVVAALLVSIPLTEGGRRSGNVAPGD